MIEFYAPIKTVSEMNQRGHWRTRHARFKRQKAEVTAMLMFSTAQGKPGPLGKAIVTLTRHSVGTLDTDNLASAFKGVRDAIAAFLGVDDGSASVTWRYEQVKARRGVCGVTVRIEEATA